MTITDIKHEIVRTKWIISTTKNWKCKKDHEKHLKKLTEQLYLEMRKVAKTSEKGGKNGY